MKGRPYLFGGNGEEKSKPFDCFGMVVEYFKLRYSIDLLFIHSTMGYNFYTYSKLQEYEVMDLFEQYLSEAFVKVDPAYKLPGDILWCEADGRGSASINLGNKLMLITSPKTNCDIIQTTYYEIKDAYRWPQLSP